MSMASELIEEYRKILEENEVPVDNQGNIENEDIPEDMDIEQEGEEQAG